jgi:hypothetical protein
LKRSRYVLPAPGALLLSYFVRSGVGALVIRLLTRLG